MVKRSNIEGHKNQQKKHSKSVKLPWYHNFGHRGDMESVMRVGYGGGGYGVGGYGGYGGGGGGGYGGGDDEEWIRGRSSLNKRKAQKLFEKFIQDLWKVARSLRILQNPLLTTMAHPELSAAELSKETFLQKITSADNTTTTGGETLKIAKSGGSQFYPFY